MKVAAVKPAAQPTSGVQASTDPNIAPLRSASPRPGFSSSVPGRRERIGGHAERKNNNRNRAHAPS
jgi:hypothetical protein